MIDLSGLPAPTGLGNTLSWFLSPLVHSIPAGRAAFLARNSHNCTPHCRFDLSTYFGAVGGVDWGWTPSTACSVARAMAARGEAERELAMDPMSALTRGEPRFVVSSGSTGPVAEIKAREPSGCGAAVSLRDPQKFSSPHATPPVPPSQGPWTFRQLLEHPSVEPLAWVRIVLPPESTFSAALRPSETYWDFLQNAGVVSFLTSQRFPVDERRAIEAIIRGDGGAEAGAGSGCAPDEPTGSELARCGFPAFLYPTPRLQRLVLPHVGRLDEAWGSCAGVVGVHYRSGYADVAGLGPWHSVRKTHAAAAGGREKRGRRRGWRALGAASEADGTSAALSREQWGALRAAWRALNNMTRGCPVRCRRGEPADPLGEYLGGGDGGLAGCAIMGPAKAGVGCSDWPNSGRVRAAVEALEQERGPAAAKGGDSGEPHGWFAFLPGEVSASEAAACEAADGGAEGDADGPLLGLLPAALTFAARTAQAVGRSQRASDAASCRLRSSSVGTASKPAAQPGRRTPLQQSARGACGPKDAAADTDDPWLVYVAGDLPLLIAAVHASPSLRGHQLTAGSGAGAIGHVSADTLCAHVAGGESFQNATGRDDEVRLLLLPWLHFSRHIQVSGYDRCQAHAEGCCCAPATLLLQGVR